jgi:hypothetical protein
MVFYTFFYTTFSSWWVGWDSGHGNEVKGEPVAGNSSNDFLPGLSENRSERASAVWPFFAR